MPKLRRDSLKTALLIILASVSVCSNADTIVIAAIESGKPLAVKTAENSYSGIYIDFLDLFGLELGSKTKYVYFPSHRAARALAQQQIDMALMLSSNWRPLKPPKNTTCLEPSFIKLQANLYQRNATPPATTRIATMSPASDKELGDMLAAHGITVFSKHRLQSSEAMFKSLASQRVDYALSSDISEQYWEATLNEHFVVTKTIDTVEVFLCYANNRFSPKSEQALKTSYQRALSKFDLDKVKANYIKPTPAAPQTTEQP